jgi:hypothetical protein
MKDCHARDAVALVLLLFTAYTSSYETCIYIYIITYMPLFSGLN